MGSLHFNKFGEPLRACGMQMLHWAHKGGRFQSVPRMSGVGPGDGRLGSVSWKTVRWKYQVLCARKGSQMPDSSMTDGPHLFTKGNYAIPETCFLFGVISPNFTSLLP